VVLFGYYFYDTLTGTKTNLDNAMKHEFALYDLLEIKDPSKLLKGKAQIIAMVPFTRRENGIGIEPLSNTMIRIGKRETTFFYRFTKSEIGTEKIRWEATLGKFKHGNIGFKELAGVVLELDDVRRQVGMGKNPVYEREKELEKDKERKETLKRKAKQNWTFQKACYEYLKNKVDPEDISRPTKTMRYSHVNFHFLKVYGKEERKIKDETDDFYGKKLGEMLMEDILLKHLLEIESDLKAKNIKHAKPNQTLKLIFAYAQQMNKVKYSVVASHKSNQSTSKPRKRIFSNGEIISFFNAMENLKDQKKERGANVLDQKVSDGIKLIWYTGMRQVEVRRIRGDNIYDKVRGEVDPNGNWLFIPDPATKTDTPYWIYLTKSAKELLVKNDFDMIPQGGTNDVRHRDIYQQHFGYIFKEAGFKEIRPEFLADGKRNREFVPEKDPMPQGKDIRRTVATRIIDTVGSEEEAHRVLNHKIKGTGQNYFQNDWAKEKQRNMIWWEKELHRILGLSDGSNVLHFG
tara:strand:+ start:117 stop:1667 length:1551 start_codon:yes stop_codon:yes gene_type:complete